MTRNTWAPNVGLSPDQLKADAEKWTLRAERYEAEGLPMLAETYRDLAEWAKGGRETVGPGTLQEGR